MLQQVVYYYWPLGNSIFTIEYHIKRKVEFVLVLLKNKFDFFYLIIILTIEDKSKWQEYIARYP